MSTRLAFPNRRNHITQKVKVAGQRIFLRLKGSDRSSELSRLYNVIARLMSLAVQSAHLERVGDLFAGAKFAPCGPVSGHDRLKSCTSLPDLIGRHLLIEYCGRGDLAHSQVSSQTESAP